MTPVEQPTEPRKAVHAFLTMPEPGQFILNLSYGGPNLERTYITARQLQLIVADGASMVWERSA